MTDIIDESQKQSVVGRPVPPIVDWLLAALLGLVGLLSAIGGLAILLFSNTAAIRDEIE